MKKIWRAALWVLVPLAAGNAAFAQGVSPQFAHLPRPENGKLTERTKKSFARAEVSVTDSQEKEIDAFGWPKSQNLGTDPSFFADGQAHPKVTFAIPEQVIMRGTGDIVAVTDVRQRLKILKDSGETSDLSIEALFRDPDINSLVLGNIFGAVADKEDYFQEVSIPDLFADTSGDGTLGDADVLYSVVDLSQYLNAVPSFALGDSFTISNGTVAELPGMLFSTTPFTFDPASGFVPTGGDSTLFSGTGMVEGAHGVSAVPEPSSLALVGLGAFGLLASGRRRCKRMC